VDHRLIRDDRLQGCGTDAWALYLFLVTVGDAHGLSYYADRTLQERIGLSETQLRIARAQLLRAGLIAYEAPLCQVLALDPPAPPPVMGQAAGAPAGEAVAIGDILRAWIGGA
jgi:hypothetical protein